MVQQCADEEDKQHQADHRSHDDQAKAPRTALVLGRRRLFHKCVGDGTKLGACASRGH